MTCYGSDGSDRERAQAGDTLTIIAKLYNTSVEALEDLNADKLSNGPDLLEIGSTIDVPLQGLPLDGTTSSASPTSNSKGASLAVGGPGLVSSSTSGRGGGTTGSGRGSDNHVRRQQAGDAHAAITTPDGTQNDRDASPNRTIEKALSAREMAASSGITAWAAAWRHEEQLAKAKAAEATSPVGQDGGSSQISGSGGGSLRMSGVGGGAEASGARRQEGQEEADVSGAGLRAAAAKAAAGFARPSPLLIPLSRRHPLHTPTLSLKPSRMHACLHAREHGVLALFKDA